MTYKIDEDRLLIKWIRSLNDTKIRAKNIFKKEGMIVEIIIIRRVLCKMSFGDTLEYGMEVIFKDLVTYPINWP